MYNQGKIMRKLLGKPTNEPSHDPSYAGVTSSPTIPQSYRPISSQNAVHSAGVPIAAIDDSPDGHSVVLGGRHILKTLRFDGVAIREGIDLRALITGPSAAKGISEQLSIKDVEWAGSASIFTACAGGKIFRYDLTRAAAGMAGGAGQEFIQIREDARQVNTLHINPHRGTFLLAGSQDSVIRCFDVREPFRGGSNSNSNSNASGTRAAQMFRCNADAVRQVQWSPRDGFFFACGTEQGAVLKWDIRKHTAPVLKINAHDKACSSVAWHPDGEHLISGGMDSRCHVWDLSKNADRRQKAKWSFQTAAPVSTVTWRPALWSATAQARRGTQVAVSYHESSEKRYGVNCAHVWDLARPSMPFKEIRQFDVSPSAMLWHSQDLLWTAGQDGLVAQCDVAYAPRVVDRQTTSAMAFSSRGDLVMFLEERAQAPRHRLHVSYADGRSTPTASYSSSPHTPLLSISRSDSDEDAIGGFLGARRRGARKRRASTRSAVSFSTTPPSIPGAGERAIMSLEEALNVSGIFKTHQAMAVGHAPDVADADEYEFLSANYLEALKRELPAAGPDAKQLVDRVLLILDHYAEAADEAGLFRLAMSWRVVAFNVDLLLRRRAQFHFESRMRRLRQPPTGKDKVAPGNRQTQPSGQTALASASKYGDEDAGGTDTPRTGLRPAAPVDKHLPLRSLLSEEIESTSNVPTPLVRPASDSTLGREGGEGLTPLSDHDGFVLPPSVHPATVDRRRRLDSEPLSIISQESGISHGTQASTEGYDFYDTEAIAVAIDVPRPVRAPPSKLAYSAVAEQRDPRRAAARHDSDESFAQLFSISDGSRRGTGVAGSPAGGQLRKFRATDSDHREDEGSDLGDGEYQSRIRGQQIHESPEESVMRPHRSFERTETGLTAMTDEHHLITQTTSDSYPSQRDDDFPSQQSEQPARFESLSPERRRVAAGPAVSVSPPPEAEEKEELLLPHVVESDYLPWPGDPDYPFPIDAEEERAPPPPLDPYTQILRFLKHEVRTSALSASAIVLLIKPLLPDGLIDSYQAAAILRQHHARLMSMKLFVEAAVLRKLCIKGWPGGALSRWGDNHPAIFTQAMESVQAGLLCSTCKKPREIDRTSASTESIWQCPRCRDVMAPCAVCGHRDEAPGLLSSPSSAPRGADYDDGDDYDDNLSTLSPFDAAEDPVISTWWYCPGCGHGGHSSCLHAWHASFDPQLALDPLAGTDAPADTSSGCCPLDGCGHACLPGRGRADILAARTEEIGRAVREASHGTKTPVGGGSSGGMVGLGLSPGEGHSAGVSSDMHEVAQSRAVETVREALSLSGAASHGAAGTGASTGILSSSPGRGGGERERRKSVKFKPTAMDDRR